MRVICTKNREEASHMVANMIAAQVLLKPDSVLGLAAGSSPIGVYADLIDRYQKGELDFTQVRTVNLDEYIGLGADHPQSYAWYMRRNLFDHIRIDRSNTHIPNGLETDCQKECKRYDRIIRSLGGVDLQLLGIGPNGHIGFNEPCGEFVRGTHCVDLSDATISANARFFESPDQVPRQAYTMGIMGILQAKRIVMIAMGRGKAQAVRDMICGPVHPEVPASILQLHSDFILVADEEALSLVHPVSEDD